LKETGKTTAKNPSQPAPKGRLRAPLFSLRQEVGDRCAEFGFGD
jgi:hypothetical protein